MATSRQHNDIVKYVFNGNKHLKHVLTNESINKMCVLEGRFPLTKLPVCGHCEKLGMWHKDSLSLKPVGVCTECGAITREPVTYSTYLANNMDVDKTGATFRNLAKLDKDRDYINRVFYLPEYNIGSKSI